MEDQGIFKTSMFGGFDKQSVLTYVDELMNKAQERENALQQRIDDLQEERDRLFKKEEELAGQVSAMEEHLSNAAETQRELNIKNARISELESKLIHSAAHIAQLETVVADNERNHHKYDEVAAQVGSVMVEAQKNADVVVARARDQAERIAQDSAQRVIEMNGRIDQVKEDIRRLRSFTVDILEDVDRRMQGLETAIDDTENHLFISVGLLPGNDEYNLPAEPRYQEAPCHADRPALPGQDYARSAAQRSTGSANERHSDDFFGAPCQS